MQLEIDFARYPAARCGDFRFDVPLNGPHGRLKKALRSVLQGFPEIESACLLVCSNPAWGDTAEPIVWFEPRMDARPLYSAWEPYVPEFGQIGFFSGGNHFAAFVSHAATPFYRREQTPKLPPPFSKPDLIRYIRMLPDEPVLARTAAYLETLKENYDHLPPEQAEAEYRDQQLEMEQCLQTMRSISTHPKAKTALLNYLAEDASFGLLLRTFATQTTTGRSAFGGESSGVRC